MNGSVFDARAERRDVLRGAFGLAAGAIGAGLALGGVGLYYLLTDSGESMAVGIGPSGITAAGRF